MKYSTYLLTIVAGVLLALGGFFLFSANHNSGNGETASIIGGGDNVKAYVLPISQPTLVPILDDSALKPEINSKAVLFYDLRSGKYLFEKNIKEKLPVASLTKVLSAIVALENLDQDDVVTIPKEAVRVDNERQDLYLGENISVRNLIRVMIVESSNDAAYALADYAQKKGIDFIQKINEKSLSIGMFDSSFTDPAGLDDDAFSTAEDMIKLVAYSLQYDVMWEFSREKEILVKSEDGRIAHTVKNTNQLLGVIPDIVGGKTGYTDQALGCLILIVDLPGYDSKIISVVLGSDDRFGDTQKVIEWIKVAYHWQ
ncbi:MAG: hypothetical protein A2750_00450 [Candidatus Yanofskybacteria bacterium RIFCSPHIGHO2_01_FULL_45_42]|uniref:Peptidase S11 D-alanyl-D-alanine carboxypeptidase A N-terminal domain-containing protein n=3 Tax=Candidatus Yanofskyibacteriota TaxID=1752733 RepID=A0A1F8H267_9BACT|nr:MAG: hypothetical protein A2750_00450 [Candidatus Yanofskybacteria bacterium RIFCSPHIGHO2_01_FULL_45_42]OGN16535.1 MAG: hypothetical protein A3C81_01805 [Candidatus Yanofskybacteria bacterium RIFCSPHIGHO2_02_FULL_46_19]OGN26439.1 MAG: hypothetical protein A3B17_03315 [Candidatus Yanofskybacteria bacterium RIFCSPLOWO2_01_FULL_45_72]OGN31734.1 MAG: hypothetical protein A3J01_00180 [Candidatus Yanofskybacteria bacterium RIFCSPLOWO2_02_FULL_45_18]